MIIKHCNGQYGVTPTQLSNVFDNLPQDVVVITDENVAQLHPIPESIRPLVLPPGESTKDLATFGRALGWLAQVGASRKTTVVAFGGGVIGDLTGFVAAAYMRGVPCLQIPTTLLAMVDSSVGGKVAIDLPEGKNLAGAFWPPVEVRLPIDALERLPERQRVNGMAEVLKYGFIMDAPLLDAVKHDSLETIVMRCVALKAKVVEEDEFETNGRRAILNFGHTTGHAIEKLTGYGPILHGEAISIGMVQEAVLGEMLEISAPGTALEVQEVLKHAGLPTESPIPLNPDAMIAAMRGDKKASGGQLAFSLLTQVGDCKLIQGVPEDEVRRVLELA